MGYKTEFDWVLVLRPEQGLPAVLEVGKEYKFQKDEERIYPRGCEIFLSGKDWKPVAKIIIKEFTVSENKTSGVFEVKEVL